MEKLAEHEILDIVNPVIAKWIPIFRSHSYRIGQIEFNSHGEEDRYFAELEGSVWKDNNIEDVFNLIIALQGKTLIQLDELELEANNEFQRIFSEISR